VRRFSWLITIPIAAIAIAFAVTNNHAVSIDLWLSPMPIELPLFAVAFVGILIGFLAGAFAAWISGGKARRLARERAREIANLNRSLLEKEHRLAEQAPRPNAVSGPPATQPNTHVGSGDLAG